SLGLKEIQKSIQIAYKSKNPHKIDKIRYDLFDQNNSNYIIKYWETENIPIFDEASKDWYILNVMKDITSEILEKDRCNLLQVKLDDKTKKHQQFFERITDGLYSLDKEGNFVSLNNGLEEIAETPKNELLKMNFLPFC